jgi:hypothetical protein
MPTGVAPGPTGKLTGRLVVAGTAGLPHATGMFGGLGRSDWLKLRRSPEIKWTAELKLIRE